jgi:hypothetical protein
MNVFVSISKRSRRSVGVRLGQSNIWRNNKLATLKKRGTFTPTEASAAGADVYVQDEAEMSLFPTLTRMWMLRGKQHKIRAPGIHPPKRHECAATDWRTGTIVRIRSEKRNAQAFCRLAEKCMTRSARRKRRVIIVVDRARIHTPEGSRLVAELLKTYGGRLRLRYLPSYSPECMPMEIF